MSGIDFDPAYLGEAPVPEPSNLEVEPLTTAGAQTTFPWPRLVKLDEDTENRLVLWFDEELRRCEVERGPLVEDWMQWQNDYWAEPESEEKNFPFRRAANIVIPITAIAVEAVHARLFNLLFSRRPFWQISPREAAWVEVSPKVERWLQAEVENPRSLNLQWTLSQALMELTKLGTMVIKTGYERLIKKSLRTMADGTDEPIVRITRDGATTDYTPLSNFYIRLAEAEVQDAPWVAEWFSWTWSQLKSMAASGKIRADQVEAIRTFWSSTRAQSEGSAAEYQHNLDEQTNQEPIWYEEFDCFEVWASFDVDGDGMDEEVWFIYERKSRTILAVRYNWYADLHRPYRIAQYVTVEGRLYGLGIGKQNEQFQQEITTIHRQRLDNATLANMGMLKVKSSLGYGPNEPIWPGKMWFVEESTDIEPFKMFEVYNSSFANEEGVLRYSEKRTSVNEVTLGMPQEGSPGTATGDMMRKEEGNRKFDATLKSVRQCLSLVGQDVLANFQQFGDAGRHWTVLGDDGRFVDEFLQMPTTLVTDGAIVEVSVTDSITNDQVEQQMWMSLSQVSFDYYQKQIELAQLIMQLTQDPQELLVVAQAARKAGDETYKRLLDAFKIVNKDDLLITKQMEVANAGGGGGQGPAGPTGAGQNNGLQALLPVLGALMGGGGPGNGGGGIGRPGMGA